MNLRERNGRNTERARGTQLGRPLLSLMLVLGCPLLFSCAADGGGRNAAPAKPRPMELAGSKWTLVSLGGSTPESEKPLTLDFGADGKVQGNAGVNRYFATFAAQTTRPGTGTIRFSEIGSTKMAGPEPLMKQESGFLDLLALSTDFIAEGGILELSAGDRPTLRFRQRRGTE